MPLPTYPISAKVSRKQLAEFDDFLARFYPDLDRSKYLRRLIADDMAQHGIEWSEYEFVDNAERTRTGVRWKVGRPRKIEGSNA